MREFRLISLTNESARRWTPENRFSDVLIAPFCPSFIYNMTDVKMYNTKHAALQFSPEKFSKMMIEFDRIIRNCENADAYIG